MSKADNRTFDKMLQVMVDDRLLLLFKRAAEADMMPSVASWVRKVLIKAAGKTASYIGGTSSPKVGRGRGWSIDPDTGEVGPSPKPAKPE